MADIESRLDLGHSNVEEVEVSTKQPCDLSSLPFPISYVRC